jgi:hypothetical protein
VEDVEELEGLLLEDEEDRVDELNVLEVVVDHVVSHQSGVESLGRADAPEGAVGDEAGEDLLKDEGEEETRADSEEQVVDLERDLELVSRAVAAWSVSVVF